MKTINNALGRDALPWSQRFFLRRERPAKQRRQVMKRQEEKIKPLVPLDLDLTFTQTPAVKRIKLIITKGTNHDQLALPMKRTNHTFMRVCKNINQSEPEGQILMKVRFKVQSNQRSFSSHHFGTCLCCFAAQEKPLKPG